MSMTSPYSINVDLTILFDNLLGVLAGHRSFSINFSMTISLVEYFFEFKINLLTSIL